MKRTVAHWHGGKIALLWSLWALTFVLLRVAAPDQPRAVDWSVWEELPTRFYPDSATVAARALQCDDELNRNRRGDDPNASLRPSACSRRMIADSISLAAAEQANWTQKGPPLFRRLRARYDKEVALLVWLTLGVPLFAVTWIWLGGREARRMG